MNKKVLAVLLVLVLAVSGLFAKDLGIKVGGQLGWGFDIAKMKISEGSDYLIVKSKNNGFAFNLTGEYAFDQNWSVKANFGMMFAGKAIMEENINGNLDSDTLSEKSGLYIDFAVDAKYTYSINDKISVAGLAGLELVSGYLGKDGDEADDKNYKNLGFGINGAVEGAYKLTNEISITGGVSAAWMFVNNAQYIKENREDAEDDGNNFSANSFYIRPYLGATYAF